VRLYPAMGSLISREKLFRRIEPLLPSKLMEHVFEQDQVAEVDYLIGDDVYKETWMSHGRERWGIIAYNSSSFGGFLGLGGATLRRDLKTRLMQLRARVRTMVASLTWTRLSRKTDLAWRFIPASAFSNASHDWHALVTHTEQGPLLSVEFVELALRYFGRGDEVVCFADTPTGTVAATILRRKNWLTWETFQPSQMPMGPWLQVQPASFPKTLQSLLRALRFPTVMVGVTQVDSKFVGASSGNSLATLSSISTNETVLPDSLADYIGTLDAKPLSGLMRRLRKAEKEVGPVTLDTRVSPGEVDGFFRLYADMEHRGWKGEAGTALVPGDLQSKFYSDLMRQFATTGKARMFVLRMGARDVAAQVAITEGGVLYLLKTTYEPALRSLGPGVMLHYLITRACYEHEEQIRRIEFYGPNNASQEMWATGRREINHFNAYRSNLIERAHSYYMKLAAPWRASVGSQGKHWEGHR
jgi:CelD/BcsL family acetyltransferase involved in cellulose biosynthesis